MECKTRALILLLLCSPAFGGSVRVDFTHPTGTTFGGTLGQTLILSTTLEYGTCVGSAFGTKIGEATVSGPQNWVDLTIPAGSYCFRAKSNVVVFGSSGWSPVLQGIVPEEPGGGTCVVPQPPPDTRTVNCPSGYNGFWWQVSTYTAAPYPTCWTAGPWLPTVAPEGACTPIEPPQTCDGVPEPAPLTRVRNCPAGYTGTWTQSNVWVTDAYPNCWVYNEWYPFVPPPGACTLIPPPPPPPPPPPEPEPTPPTPAPPTPTEVTVFTVDTVVKEHYGYYGRGRLVEVGTIKTGVQCGKRWRSTDTYYRVPRSDVTFTKRWKKGRLYSRCAPADGG